MTFTSVVRTCTGAIVAGTFHWDVAASGQTGDTKFNGTFEAATGTIEVDESEPNGSVVSAHDTMHYDAKTDRPVDGSWTCGCPAGAWQVATRRSTLDASTTCH